MTQHEQPPISKDEATQTQPVGDDFEAEVPQSAPSAATPDDWPEGEVEPGDPVGPAIGQRFADVHVERPWLLPAFAVASSVALAALVALRWSRGR